MPKEPQLRPSPGTLVFVPHPNLRPLEIKDGLILKSIDSEIGMRRQRYFSIGWDPARLKLSNLRQAGYRAAVMPIQIR